jgi:hypothetical protein
VAATSGHDGTLTGTAHDVAVISWLRARWIDAAAYFTGRTKIALPAAEDVFTMLSFPRTRPVSSSRKVGDDVKITQAFLHDVIPAGTEKLGTQETTSDQNVIMISPMAVTRGTKPVLVALVYAAIDLAARPEQFDDKASGAPRFRKRTKAYNALVKSLSLSTHAPNYDMETSAVAAWAETKAQLVGDPPSVVVEVAKTLGAPAKRESKTKPLACKRDHVKSIAGYAPALETSPLACVECVVAEMAERGLDSESIDTIKDILTASLIFPKVEPVEASTSTGEAPVEAPPSTPTEAPVQARAASPKANRNASRRASAHK